MTISEVYPFISYLPVARTDTVSSIPLDRVFLYPNLAALSIPVINLYPPSTTFFHFKNSDIYVPKTSSVGEAVSSYINLIKNYGKRKWTVLELNPDIIHVEDDGSGILLLPQIGNSVRIKLTPQDYEIYRLLTDSSAYNDPNYFLGDTDYRKFILKPKSITEGMGADQEFSSAVASGVPEIKFGAFEYVMTYLSSTPGSTAVEQQVPLLVGHTGVSKSAIIKGAVSKLSSKFGYRMLDIRVSFMDRLDIDGFVALINPPDGSAPVFDNSPMRDLITVTDNFIGTVREFLRRNELQEMIAAEPQTLKELQEYAKTPVVVFEEINRCPKEIRQVLTTMLNQKSLLQYTMKEARFIATGNLPVGDKASVEALTTGNFYSADGFNDPAYRKRFTFIDVDPTRSSSVRDSWNNWAYGPPYPRDVVLIDPNSSSKIAGHLAVVDKPDTNAKISDKETIAFFVYDCGPMTPDVMIKLASNEVLQRFIDKAYRNSSGQYSVTRGDMQVLDFSIADVAKTETGEIKSLGDSNIDHRVLGFLNSSPKDLYNMETVLNAVDVNAQDVNTVDNIRYIPITTFRSWEFISKLLRTKDEEGQKTLFNETLSGLLDQSTATRLAQHLSSKYKYTMEQTQDKLSDLLDEGLMSNIPVMLMGPSSIGKTSRVKRIVKKLQKFNKNGVELFNIDLSTKTRTGVRGFTAPSETVAGIFTKKRIQESKVLTKFKEFYHGNYFTVGDMVSYAPEDVKGNVFKVLQILNDGKVSIQEYEEDLITPINPLRILEVQSTEVYVYREVPAETTEPAYNKQLVEAVKRAKAKHKTIVLFLDEFNRVQSPTLMTVALEAISDNKLMGVDMTGVDFRIVCACNAGVSNTDTQILDPAIIARFLNVRKLEADVTDFRAFMEYAKTTENEKNIHPLILKAIEKMGSTEAERYNAFKELFFEPEIKADSDRKYSCSRDLASLTNFLYGDGLTQPISGTRLAKDRTLWSNYLHAAKNSDELFHRWIGKNYKLGIEINNKILFCDVIMRDLQEDYYDKLNTASPDYLSQMEENYFMFVSKVELFFEETRSKILVDKLGVTSDNPAMAKFLVAFNTIADETLSWSDLIDSSLVLEYLKMTYANKDDVLTSMVSEFPVLLKRASKDFPGYQPKDYVRWIVAVLNYLNDLSQKSEFIEIVKAIKNDVVLYKLFSDTLLDTSDIALITNNYKN